MLGKRVYVRALVGAIMLAGAWGGRLVRAGEEKAPATKEKPAQKEVQAPQQGEPQRRTAMDPEEMKKRAEEFRKRREAELRESLNVKTDEEWEVINTRIKGITKLRTAIFGLTGPLRLHQYYARAKKEGREIPKFYEEYEKSLLAESPELADAMAAAKALVQALIDEKATNAEIKEKLAAYHKARSEFEARLKKAQDELRQLLDARQEAVLIAYGVLD